MRHLLIEALAGSGLLLFGLNAAAQPPRDAPYYNRGEFESAQSLFRQVRTDIDRAERNAYDNFSGDRSRFARVRGELSELQRQWDENEYAPSQVDNVIVALQRVMDDNNLSYRDRDMLASDLRQLRDFRSGHGY
jgi:hypothetical protein